MALAVEMRGVRRTFPDLVVLDGIDLAIEEGTFVAIVGPSGCGKSTLLRIVAGLDRPNGGEATVPDRRDLAYVFQDAHLLPWRTVEENVALPLELRGVPAAERSKAVHDALVDVELADFAKSRPAELSGGMRMRASIARALVTRPKVLLMDEPFAALDEITRHRLDEKLRALFHAHRFTVLFVTHAIFEATFLAERAIVLSKRPARILHDERIALPDARTTDTRGEPAFAHEAAKLLRALERGSAR